MKLVFQQMHLIKPVLNYKLLDSFTLINEIIIELKEIVRKK